MKYHLALPKIIITRIKTTSERIAIAAVSSSLLLMVSVGLSATAHATPPPPGPSCPASEDFFWNNEFGYVDHYYSTGGWFTDPGSGHQELCAVWIGTNGLNQTYFHMEEVGGSGAGECVNAPDTFNLELASCSQTQENQVWVESFNIYDDYELYNSHYGSGLCLSGDKYSGTVGVWDLESCNSSNAQEIFIDCSGACII
jgi:hypothetical protein